MNIQTDYAAAAPEIRITTAREYRVALQRLRELEGAASGSSLWLERQALERAVSAFLNAASQEPRQKRS